MIERLNLRPARLSRLGAFSVQSLQFRELTTPISNTSLHATQVGLLLREQLKALHECFLLPHVDHELILFL